MSLRLSASLFLPSSVCKGRACGSCDDMKCTTSERGNHVHNSHTITGAHSAGMKGGKIKKEHKVSFEKKLWDIIYCRHGCKACEEFISNLSTLNLLQDGTKVHTGNTQTQLLHNSFVKKRWHYCRTKLICVHHRIVIQYDRTCNITLHLKHTPS